MYNKAFDVSAGNYWAVLPLKPRGEQEFYIIISGLPNVWSNTQQYQVGMMKIVSFYGKSI